MSKQLRISDDLYRYIDAIGYRSHPLLARLQEETAATYEESQMQISALQGSLLAMLLRMMGAKRMLEIGVFTGYSSLVCAMALPDDGEIVACDVSEDYTAMAQRYWDEAGVSHKIDLRIGSAIQTLETLVADSSQWFDFVFIDADKINILSYYELSLKLVRRGGIIAVDNTLRNGRVLSDDPDEDTRAIMDLNERIHADARVDMSLLPIADGLTLARRR